MAFVGGRQLHADPSFSSRHYRIEKPDDIDSLIVKLPCHFLDKRCIMEHNRNDRMETISDLEADLLDVLSEVCRVRFKLVPKIGRLLKQVGTP